MLYDNFAQLIDNLKQSVEISNGNIELKNRNLIKEKFLDELVENLSLNPDGQIKETCFKIIQKQALEEGIIPSSIHDFYIAIGKGEVGGFTTPAMNLRCLTYDVARAVIRSCLKLNIGAFIFEIARSEIVYTKQRPKEYTGLCLAACIKEGFKGPIFMQGDHFQVKAKKFRQDREIEISQLEDLIKEAIAAGFYNIDIDSSTLVDLEKESINEQQSLNYQVCSELTRFIRQIQPEGIQISIGGEIGEVGGKNSTPEELEAFMEGYRSNLGNSVGINKISVQTGTDHGGVVLPDGSIADVKLDFDTLKNLSKLAKGKYGLAGCVQHGASTLPPEAFHKFPEVETAEVHLATEFQNIVYESKYFPEDLRQKMYSWIKENLASERKSEQTEEQFIYKTRKKAFGPFKKELMNLPQETRDNIGIELEEKFTFLFKELKVTNTKELIEKYKLCPTYAVGKEFH